MLAASNQDAAKIDQSFAIQLQSFNRSPSNCRKSQNLGCVIRPRKMIGPMMSAWVEQDHTHFRHRIACLPSIVFVIVASLAREREIGRRIFALTASWPDMFDREALMGEGSGTAAIFTSASRASKNEFAQRFPTFCHLWPPA
jgi:hypothetical protein